MKVVINPSQSEQKTTKQPVRPIVAATFPEDLGISAVSLFMSRQQQDVELEELQQDDNPSEEQPPPSLTTIVAQDLPSNRFRLNLICHKFATSTELSTLQLFKGFTTAAKKTDKTIVFLPIDSTKQSLSHLMSQKQIDSMMPNQL
jgi:hypothetical protein